MSRGDRDLGGGFAYRFFQWEPGVRLNPQNRGKLKIDPAGIILLKDDIPIGSCWFDLPETHAIPGNDGPFWQLHSIDPLHLEPSIQTHAFTYGDQDVPAYHGHIREGRWQPA